MYVCMNACMYVCLFAFKTQLQIQIKNCRLLFSSEYYPEGQENFQGEPQVDLNMIFFFFNININIIIESGSPLCRAGKVIQIIKCYISMGMFIIHIHFSQIYSRLESGREPRVFTNNDPPTNKENVYQKNLYAFCHSLFFFNRE